MTRSNGMKDTNTRLKIFIYFIWYSYVTFTLLLSAIVYFSFIIQCQIRLKKNNSWCLHTGVELLFYKEGHIRKSILYLMIF